MIEKMWAIQGKHGLYIGTWYTRSEAKQEHAILKSKTWEQCYKNGDRVVRVEVKVISRQAQKSAGR